MNRKIRWMLLAAMMLAMLFSGCSKNEELSYEGQLKFTGLDTEFSVAYNDIYAMESVSTVVNNISSDGEEGENKVEGVLLETLLNEKGLSQKDFTNIRFIAGDGYAMDVPSEIVAEKEIILAYRFDGENLDEKKLPLRVAIDDVRTMYYVSNLVEIQFTQLKAEDGASEVILLETAYLGLNAQSFTYYDSEDSAILISDLFEKYLDKETDKVYMLSSDGYDKTESYDVVKDGYLKITGKDSPLFTGKDLPKGMNVKELMNMQAGSVSFASVARAADALERRTISDIEGVALDKFVEMAGLNGDFYMLKANDGYTIEVSKDSLSKALVYISGDGTCRAKFEESFPKNTNIKNLLLIKTSDGSKCVTGEIEVTAEEEDEIKIEMPAWTIVVEGLSDGSFDMTSDRAQRKLELVELHTERTKNDEIRPEDWKGYRLLDVLDFLHVEDFESVVIVAVDGYEMELTKEQVDEETILAVEKNGEVLTDDDNLVQLVQNTEFATTWVKGVVKIIINNEN